MSSGRDNSRTEKFPKLKREGCALIQEAQSANQINPNRTKHSIIRMSRTKEKDTIKSGKREARLQIQGKQQKKFVRFLK